MRAYATFLVTALMTLGLLFLLFTRARFPHDAPVTVIEVAAPGGEVADAAAEASAERGAGAAAAIDAAVDGAASGAPHARPVRVTTLGWELAAPGVALAMASRGSGAPVAPGIEALELAPESDLEAVEARLARGGDALDGADVAVMPLPSFVVAYETLRALEPRAFLVAGFSRGREELRAAPGALLKPPPAAEDVRLVGLSPRAAGSVEARVAGSESATVLGLYVLRAMGIAPARVRFVGPTTGDARGAPYAALVRGAPDERKPALSTADASRLVPIVLVAPRAQLETRAALSRDLGRAWLDGLARVARDPGAVARAIADGSAVPLVGDAGARPDALALVDGLGRLDAASLEDQGPLLLGTRPGSLSSLASATWALAREGGLTTGTTPEPLPLETRVVDALGVAAPPPPEPSPPAEPDAGAPLFAPAPVNATTLFVMRDPGLASVGRPSGPSVDLAPLAAASASELAAVAAVFPRAVLRVSASGGEKNARVFAAAARDAGVPASRLATSGAVVTGALVSVDVLALP